MIYLLVWVRQARPYREVARDRNKGVLGLIRTTHSLIAFVSLAPCTALREFPACEQEEKFGYLSDLDLIQNNKTGRIKMDDVPHFRFFLGGQAFVCTALGIFRKPPRSTILAYDF